MTSTASPATTPGAPVGGNARLPRDLHPVAWWVWAIGLAAAASGTTNPLSLLLLVGVAALVVSARRSDQPWAGSFRLYLWLGLAIVVVRVLFRILLGGGYAGGPVLLDLPEIPLPDAAAGIALLGPLTSQALLAGLYDGMRLATIVVCIGAANSLANPKRLLRSVPPALYEIGTALVVAVTVLPQLADSVRRVRAAQGLRAGAGGRTGLVRRSLVPVLEDALDRSLAMAAGMDARGYGRSPEQGRGARLLTGSLMVAGLVGVCVGVYALLDTTAPRVLALPMLGLGVVLAVAGLATAGQRVERTRYRPDRWRWPDLVVASSGVGAGALGLWVAREQLAIAHPPLDGVPTVSAAVLLATGLALAGGLAAPDAAVRGGGAS
ncbi:energy-coupling factor transport system permease protein [Nocardioides marinisabuli]|uniref:Energy-coupling factor transport system permease protein n=1 Tax=Nocardioides marinisabuli TaxID=419476 RepID=A0A7Y9JQL7_9ACTN|nr:energy-coupling factor transporter transmembrane component T [Nocardioides marinisabuli]NYD58222.1 energy-coupling factor transport system permease protein [Nocardioides marinisabuli]